MSRGKNHPMKQGSSNQTKNRELATLVARLTAFLATLIPLGRDDASPGLPWMAWEAVSGVGAIALLVPPMSEYLYAVSPLQAAILTLGPILVALLAIVIQATTIDGAGRSSGRRPAMLAVAVAIAYGATDLVAASEQGLDNRDGCFSAADFAPSCYTHSGGTATKVENAHRKPGTSGRHRVRTLPLERIGRRPPDRTNLTQDNNWRNTQSNCLAELNMVGRVGGGASGLCRLVCPAILQGTSAGILRGDNGNEREASARMETAAKVSEISRAVTKTGASRPRTHGPWP